MKTYAGRNEKLSPLNVSNMSDITSSKLTWGPAVRTALDKENRRQNACSGKNVSNKKNQCVELIKEQILNNTQF